jgi:hypothetical protein
MEGSSRREFESAGLLFRRSSAPAIARFICPKSWLSTRLVPAVPVWRQKKGSSPEVLPFPHLRSLASGYRHGSSGVRHTNVAKENFISVKQVARNFADCVKRAHYHNAQSHLCAPQEWHSRWLFSARQ